MPLKKFLAIQIQRILFFSEIINSFFRNEELKAA